MKKFTALLLSLLLCCNVFLVSAASLGNFSVQREANEQTFSDISPSDWFYQDVLSAYSYGLANGMGDGQFSPGGMVSIAEAITFGARVH